MHKTQRELLDILRKVNVNFKNPRIIGKLIGVEHPQSVVHHLLQLEDKKFISINKETGVITMLQSDAGPSEGLLKLPIFGTANCGPATIFAEQNLEGYLAVPREKIGRKRKESLFIVEAVGDSMNAAKKVKGGSIESGDYVIIDKDNTAPENGNYVLSIIDGMANIKRFYNDKEKHRIRLESESIMEMKPIYINEGDFRDYMVNGVVVSVVKQNNN